MLEIRVRIRLLMAQAAEYGQSGSSKVNHSEAYVSSW